MDLYSISSFSSHASTIIVISMMKGDWMFEHVKFFIFGHKSLSQNPFWKLPAKLLSNFVVRSGSVDRMWAKHGRCHQQDRKALIIFDHQPQIKVKLFLLTLSDEFK
jgi:hypothetical protein